MRHFSAGCGLLRFVCVGSAGRRQKQHHALLAAMVDVASFLPTTHNMLLLGRFQSLLMLVLLLLLLLVLQVVWAQMMSEQRSRLDACTTRRRYVDLYRWGIEAHLVCVRHRKQSHR
jgi:hypothetical protein